MKNLLGFVCQILAALIAVLGLVPAAILVNPWRNAKLASQIDEIYFGSNLARAGVVALAGFVVAYIVFRIGVHLKSGCRFTPQR
jgi:hypothetical protein